jgi:hypothetical protein
MGAGHALSPSKYFACTNVLNIILTCNWNGKRKTEKGAVVAAGRIKGNGCFFGVPAGAFKEWGMEL